MKDYKAYMDRQEVTPEFHQKLLDLKQAPARRTPAIRWQRFGALAACCALALGVGVWKWTPQAQPQMAEDAVIPGIKDAFGPGESPEDGFVVEGPDGKLMFPMLPGINYGERKTSLDSAACIALPDGSFDRELTQEQIAEIFWGPEGNPDMDSEETAFGNLPWMLFWEGYTLRGRATYDGEGKLFWLHIWGEHPDGAEFTLELAPGHLPLSDLIEPGRATTDVRGISVTGWSQSYDRNGDDITDYICGSEFVAKEVGVRFENVGGPFRSEYGGSADMAMGGAQQFNALLVNWATYPDGGLYLGHLLTCDDIPDWRVEEFSTLADARQEAEFALYLPTQNIPGYGEFFGRLDYQEERENRLFVRWSRGYDDVEVCVYRGGERRYHLVDASNPASYDVRLYEIPWCDSVPEVYWETVNAPAFRAEDMSLAVVEARVLDYEDAGDSGGPRIDFEILHPDGTLVSYGCKGLSADQVWAMVEATL